MGTRWETVPPPRPPAPPSIWRRRWPGPTGGASQPALVAITGAALITAASLPLDRPGVGWLVGAVAGTVALGVAIRRPSSLPAGPPPSPTPSRPTEPPTSPATGGPATTSPAGTTSSPTLVAATRTASGDTEPASTKDVPVRPTAGSPPVTVGADATAAGPSTVRSGSTGEPDRTGTVEPVRTGPARWGVARLFWAATTVALMGVGSLRAAGWLFVFCLLTAAVTACLTVMNGKTLPGLFFSVLLTPESVFRARSWARSGLRGSTRAGRAGIGRTLATAAVSVCLLVVFGALFASADAAFADLLDALLPELSVGTVFRWIFVGLATGGLLLGAAYVLAAPPDLSGLERPARHRLRRLEWAVPVALLDLLFAAFVLVQLANLFGGSAHVRETAGLTYAEHARGGFWQLLSVTVLTLMVIGGAVRWAPRETVAERLLIRVLLGALTLFSLVVVASALYRMNVYTQVYGATRLRLLVAACELWLGAVFLLVLVAGVRLRASWLPRLVVGAAVLALLGLAVANPDRLIAERNVDRFLATDRLDLEYLSRLSADAVPALDRLPDPWRDCALREIAQDLTDHPDDWRSANLGRSAAWELLRADPVTGPSQRYGTCPGAR
ncbi:DUF4153 domain-containing protein [Micromonospora sp. NPDC050417]|uniref:DUF4153 domain-containing protein n=1 Tax=Micromonospora sp. NPDC050417 TaxID=3364280 RepID=UPI0037BAC54C